MAADPAERHRLIADLNHEWARLVGRHRGQLPWGGALAGHRDLAELLAAIRDRPDRLLGALLHESAAGDLLAARTVLQAMLGKVVRLAQACPDAGTHEFVAALWCRIRTYPLSRRPTSIAANLALDTRKDVLRQLSADRAALRPTAGQLPSGAPDQGDLGHDDARWVVAVAEEQGLIDPVTATVLRAVYLDGANSRVAAARLGTSPGMIRYRCSRGLRALARHAVDLHPARFEEAA